MMKAESLNSDRVICKGMVRLEDAARGWGDVNEGRVDKYVFSGLAYPWVRAYPLRCPHMKTCLHSCFEREKGITAVAHLEDASKPVLSQVADL